jgi:hypothetical protein
MHGYKGAEIYDVDEHNRQGCVTWAEFAYLSDMMMKANETFNTWICLSMAA